MVMKVLAGDFKKGTAAFKKAKLGLGRATHLVMPKGIFARERLALSEIASVEAVTAAQGIDGANAVWGALALGPVGLLAGLVGLGNRLVGVTFKDGRRALMECGGEDMKVLQAAVFQPSI